MNQNIKYKNKFTIEEKSSSFLDRSLPDPSLKASTIEAGDQEGEKKLYTVQEASAVKEDSVPSFSPELMVET